MLGNSLGRSLIQRSELLRRFHRAWIALAKTLPQCVDRGDQERFRFFMPVQQSQAGAECTLRVRNQVVPGGQRPSSQVQSSAQDGFTFCGLASTSEKFSEHDP